MHDGSLNSLEDVLAHYNLGGKGHHNQSVRIAPLNLTKEETTAIIAFLKTLTDTSFLDRSAFQHH